MAELVTTRVHIADILTAQGATHEGVFIVKGDALLGVDLSELTDRSITAVDEDQKTARIMLPPPHVILARVDHDKTRTWDVKRTTWIPFVGDPDLLRDEAMRQAQALVNEAAKADEPMSIARAHAESVIATFYQGLGWRVTISWADNSGGGP